MSVYEAGPDWEGVAVFDEQWEPWMDADEPDPDPIGCHYCDSPDTRIEPFGGKPCCDACFVELIGGERDDPPFRCLTCESAAPQPQEAP